MVPTFKQSKVYIGIVRDIREMITADGLKPGDKIPSERELAERLQVGRSSVREALRALELLGLIETRRGEGTYLSDFKNHQLIKILGLFILEEPHVKKDVILTKRLLEKDILRDIGYKDDHSELIRLRQDYETEFETLLSVTDNWLLYRIWDIVSSYSTGLDQPQLDTYFTKQIMDKLIERNVSEALFIYDKKHT